MTAIDAQQLFSDTSRVAETMSVSELADWALRQQEPRLRLPPIQRSLVWTNAQIIAYWDSLLRGFPPGVMMVHGSKSGDEGRTLEGRTEKAPTDGFQLFDGQQRLNAILIGLGKVKRDRRLWIDLGASAATGDFAFALRINSTGQPFGYRADEPNQKFTLDQRRTKLNEWQGSPAEIFKKLEGPTDLIGSKCAIPFPEFLAIVQDVDDEGTVERLCSTCPSADPDLVRQAAAAARRALNSPIVLLRVDDSIVTDPEEYIRFFQRLGQGGTALSNDELVYSIIKQHYPRVQDRVAEIMDETSGIGRLLGEVDLVLAALRASRAMTRYDADDKWGLFLRRPQPQDVRKVAFNDPADPAAQHFKSFLPEHPEEPAALLLVLKNLRDVLEYHPDDNPDGLPRMLMARLHRELIDVLVLWGAQQAVADATWSNGDAKVLRAFVLHWLLFVASPDKAAMHVYQRSVAPDWQFKAADVSQLLADFEAEGIARFAPRTDDVQKLRQQADEANPHFRAWAERFTAMDHAEHRPGEALRVLSTHRELLTRALMWIQRDYLETEFPYFDPTSGRDEDLPVDLDHIVPQNAWGFYWKDARVAPDLHKVFWEHRGTIGNSIGNFRLLSAAHNRGKGAGLVETDPHPSNYIANVDAWNVVIEPKQGGDFWDAARSQAFQSLADLRTLRLYEEVLTTSGLSDILPRSGASITRSI